MLQAATIHSIIYMLISTRSLAVNYIHEVIQGTKAAIVYIYCDYKNPKTQSELELLSSIARQLTEQTSSIPRAVKEFCGKNAERRRNPTGDEWISLVKSICLHFQTTYVFVDALVIFFYPTNRFNKSQGH
jgi:ankyrin repeat domain-containing protein 50